MGESVPSFSFNPLARRGGLFFIIGPSGSGKSTIIKELCRRDPSLIESLSTTTRAPRPGEVQGVDYNFMTTDTFNALAAQGGFAQHVTYQDNLYGTLRAPVDEALRDGRDTLFAVTLEGRSNLERAYMFEERVPIFICPPNEAVLEQRLRGRGTDSEEVVARRMRSAAEEMRHLNTCPYVVVNDKLEDAVLDVQNIIAAQRLLRARQPGVIALGDRIRQHLSGMRNE
jgi:guanylate kinase